MDELGRQGIQNTGLNMLEEEEKDLFDICLIDKIIIEPRLF